MATVMAMVMAMAAPKRKAEWVLGPDAEARYKIVETFL